MTYRYINHAQQQEDDSMSPRQFVLFVFVGLFFAACGSEATVGPSLVETEDAMAHDFGGDFLEVITDIPRLPDIKEDATVPDMEEDAEADSRPMRDLHPLDVARDVPAELVEDIPVEVAEDVPLEVVEDIPVEVQPDVPPELVEDVPVDVQPDVPVDLIEDALAEVQPEVTPDVIEDAPVDVQPDVLIDVAEDVPADVQPDVPVDMAVDVVPVDVQPDIAPIVVVVTITSEPIGVYFRVDDDTVTNYTPAEISLTEGQHTVHIIDLTGCFVSEDILIMVSETSFAFNVTLVPLTVVGDFTSEPIGATVTEGGEVVCEATPCLAVEQTACAHTYVFNLDGYYDETVESFLDNDYVVDAMLEAMLPVLLTVTSTPTDAVVSIDNEPAVCRTPCSMEVPEGQHEVIVNSWGFVPVVLDEFIDATNNTFDVTFAAATEDLTVPITSQPSSTLRLDGTVVCNSTLPGNCQIAIGPGIHVFEFYSSCVDYKALLFDVQSSDPISETLTGKVWVSITSNTSAPPPTAYIDPGTPDEVSGMTPFMTCVSPGEHAVMCVLPTYPNINAVFDTVDGGYFCNY